MFPLLILVNIVEIGLGTEIHHVNRQLSPTTTVADIGLQFSYVGPVLNKHCIQITESLPGWEDNYLCFNKNYGVKYSKEGPGSPDQKGMKCTHIFEPADTGKWINTHLCVPSNLPWHFGWSHYTWNDYPHLREKECVAINEPLDKGGVNHLCIKTTPKK